MTRDTPDILVEVRDDLRDHDPLTSLLDDDPSAIYIGQPADDRGFPASVTLTLISESSTPNRGVLQRTVRIQVTVTATREWREFYDARDDQPASVTRMGRILSRVGDRLDRGHAVSQEIPLGSDGGPAPQEVGDGDDGRFAAIEDWLVAGWYTDG